MWRQSEARWFGSAPLEHWASCFPHFSTWTVATKTRGTTTPTLLICLIPSVWTRWGYRLLFGVGVAVLSNRFHCNGQKIGEKKRADDGGITSLRSGRSPRTSWRTLWKRSSWPPRSCTSRTGGWTAAANLFEWLIFRGKTEGTASETHTDPGRESVSLVCAYGCVTNEAPRPFLPLIRGMRSPLCNIFIYQGRWIFLPSSKSTQVSFCSRTSDLWRMLHIVFPDLWHVSDWRKALLFGENSAEDEIFICAAQAPGLTRARSSITLVILIFLPLVCSLNGSTDDDDSFYDLWGRCLIARWQR